MQSKVRNIGGIIFNGILNSYSQIFFSNSKVFAWLLIVATFLDPLAGISGLLAIVITQGIAWWLGYSEEYIKNGTYSYNSLMVGLAIGFFYNLNGWMLLILVIASLITFFATIWLINLTSKQGAPFLSIPFLIGVWTIILGARNFSMIKLKERSFEDVGQFYYGKNALLNSVHEFVNNLQLPDPVVIYFKSMGAILFQFDLLAGIIIVIGLIYFSRIAFSLSVIGYATGYLFYYFLEGDFTQLVYSYIGFNFILTAIALGGFFVIPSRKSYFLVILVIPIIALMISAMSNLFYIFQVPMYSLPFNVVVIGVLISLNLRMSPNGLFKVLYQTYSPEINHYKHYNQIERFKTQNFIQVFLPFLGEWRVSQGHNGEITHKDDWKEAWDFDIQDDQGKTYRMPGKNTDDYYCYNLPVMAPANGYVAEVRDDIDDNKIGDSDLDNNWGNTIIIKHAEFLFSNLSHLKKGSITVKKDDYVKKGDIIAYVGNSGRSPEPHLHFQFQSTRYVGSKTMKYPFSFFIQNDNGKYLLRENEIPQKDELVSNIKTTDILKKSFNFPPGKVFKFDVSGLDEIDILKWEVFTTSYNQRYIYCHHSKSYAYFVESGNVFYFTDFTGDKKSLLYYFYLGAQKVLLGYYEGVGISDKLLTHGLFRGPLLFLQDFAAPFYHFLHARFKAEFTDIDDTFNPTGIKIKSSANTYLFGKLYKSIDFEFVLSNDALNYFLVKKDGKVIKASCISN